MQRKERMTTMLERAFSPVKLTVDDESHTHRRQGVETHFFVLVVSEKFKDQSRLERHRKVNALLRDEFETGLHALSLYLYTPEEYQKKQNDPQSPKCQHHQ